MTLTELDLYFRDYLELADYEQSDVSLNGIQIGEGSREVKKVAFAVDACMETFIRAVREGADMLFVHHGLYWGTPIRITGDFYKRIKYLLDNNLALYAAHLPLDSHPEVGNNARIAMQMGLQSIEPFGAYHGKMIGCKGVLPGTMDLDGVLGLLGLDRDGCHAVLPFGKREIRTIGIISGGGTRDVAQAMEQNLDLYLTGEVSHQIYHSCMEGGIHYIAAGHYFSETFGVRAMAEKMTQTMGLETVFVDVPTGL
ncbi:MAG: Nif3-like dinuclear metal center hexameric protein [Spirochaetales bacterium]|nr:Nif3-like dinuclear metal center hexameric protein [Spirochaetales bacterium]